MDIDENTLYPQVLLAGSGQEAITLKPTREAIIRQVQTTRTYIDRAFRYAKYAAELIDRSDGGRNVALAITHLEDAQLRMGLALGDLGHKLPEEYRDEA